MLPVPAENLIGEEGRGFRYILDGMNAERILIAAECIGDAVLVHRQARPPTPSERVVFGRPIGQNQGVQFPIARAYANARRRPDGAMKAARLFDAGEPCGAEANMAKLLAAEASWRAADMCLQTHGGFGFAEEFDIERKFRETRLYQVAPISTNLILAPTPSMCSACRGRTDGAAHARGPARRRARTGGRGADLHLAGWRTPARASSRSSGRRAISRAATTTVVHGESAYFVWLNRGKQSVVLDLTKAADKAFLAAMIARADVFVQNLKPGAVAKARLPHRQAAARTSAPDLLLDFGFRRNRAVCHAQSL
jgi:hypothetical protein